MGDITENLTGLKTALENELKSSEDQTEKSSTGKFCAQSKTISGELPLFNSSLSEDSTENENCLVKGGTVQVVAEDNRGNSLSSGQGGAGLPCSSVKKAGRPKGARNRSTEDWRKFFFAKVKKSPLIMLGELYCKDTAELAREMSCDRIDALKTQVAAANAVLPYVHQKQPIAIEDHSQNLPAIYINVSQADAKLLNAQAQSATQKMISASAISDAEFTEVLSNEYVFENSE